MDEVRNMKAWCLSDPENCLWCSTTKNMQEVRNIFYKLKQLQYSDRPDYDYIRDQLTTLLQKEEGTHPSVDIKTSATVNFLLH